MQKAQWAWTYTGPKGEFSGHVEAVDPRDALSRALTAETASGQPFGQEHGVLIDVLAEATANASIQYAMAGEGFVMHVRKVA